MKKLLDFLYKLEDNKVYYRLSKPSGEFRRCIMVEVAVPGERWEVDFFENNEVEVEVFRSDGILYNDEHADDLIKQLLDTTDPKWTFDNPPPPIVLPEL